MKKLIPILILAVIALGAWKFWPRTHGTLTVSAADGSKQTEDIQSCHAGFGSQPTLFGVHLKTTDDTTIFIHDSKLIHGTATHIELMRRGESTRVIDPKDCSTLNTTLSWGEGNIYTDVRNHTSGQVSARCALGDGTEFQVEASVRRCSLQ